MARVLLLTNTLGASAEVLPSLGLLQHQVKILPAEASILIDIPEIECLFIDARRDLPAAKSLTRVIQATGIDCPMIAITTEGGLSAFNSDWGITDVILDTAGPAEVDARIRIAIGKNLQELVAQDPSVREIRQGDVIIDETSYTAKIKGRSLDLTFKEFELLKYFAQHPGRVFTRAQLLDAIHGVAFESYERAIDAHIKNIRRKIEIKTSDPRYVLTVYGVGYKFADK